MANDAATHHMSIMLKESACPIGFTVEQSRLSPPPVRLPFWHNKTRSGARRDLDNRESQRTASASGWSGASRRPRIQDRQWLYYGGGRANGGGLRRAAALAMAAIALGYPPPNNPLDQDFIVLNGQAPYPNGQFPNLNLGALFAGTNIASQQQLAQLQALLPIV